MTETSVSRKPAWRLFGYDYAESAGRVSPMAAAITELSCLPNGTELDIAISGSAVTLTAPGMRQIRLTIPAGRVVVDEALSSQLTDLADMLAEAHHEGERIESGYEYLVDALLIAAGESGVSL